MGNSRGRALSAWDKQVLDWKNEVDRLNNRFKDSQAVYKINSGRLGGMTLFFYESKKDILGNDYIDGYIRYHKKFDDGTTDTYTFSVGSFNDLGEYSDYIVETYGDYIPLKDSGL